MEDLMLSVESEKLDDAFGHGTKLISLEVIWKLFEYK